MTSQQARRIAFLPTTLTAVLLLALSATTTRAQTPPQDHRQGFFGRVHQPDIGQPENDVDQIRIDCPSAEEVARMFVPLQRIETDLRLPAKQRLPIDCSKDLFSAAPDADRGAYGKFVWERVPFYWAATDFFHKPLYWDQQPLERYGQSICPQLQPLISGAHFFATFPIIPYKIGVDRVWDHVYTLGLYRPGSPAPCLGQTLPWEWDAAAFQALSTGGFIVIFP